MGKLLKGGVRDGAVSTAQGKAGGAERTMASWTDTLCRIRAVLFEGDGGTWSAQCLEYDIAAQAQTLLDLQDELVRVLVTHVAASIQLGRTPFSGIKEAPQRFWALYEGALRVESRPQQFGCAAMPLPPIAPDLRIARSPAIA